MATPRVGWGFLSHPPASAPTRMACMKAFNLCKAHAIVFVEPHAHAAETPVGRDRTSPLATPAGRDPIFPQIHAPAGQSPFAPPHPSRAHPSKPPLTCIAPPASPPPLNSTG
eukprot:19294-Chlamydomonas_euryale.AAC.1